MMSGWGVCSVEKEMPPSGRADLWPREAVQITRGGVEGLRGLGLSSWCRSLKTYACPRWLVPKWSSMPWGVREGGPPSCREGSY